MAMLTFEELRSAVDGKTAAFRSVTRLSPAGGPGDKVFPPTYAVGDRAPTRYAMETRRVDGKEIPTVLLDSVASQANRHELALLEAWRRGELRFPMMYVDFREVEDLEDLAELTVLEAPHRVADALFRDSELDGVPFRMSDLGRAFTEASPRAATPVFLSCPTGLVFGVWDSTGPKGGMGAKYQRALVSEIVGLGASTGVKTASRIDPAAIQSGVPIFRHKDASQEWTVDPEEAVQGKGGPELFSRSASDKGKPSGINHGNVAPSIDEAAGGVTIDYALQTSVLSLGALRRLRFPTAADGQLHERAKQRTAETAARSALAALALASMAHQREVGYDLRSRCLLVPEAPFVLEALPHDGSEPKRYELTTAAAAELLDAARVHASEQGMAWPLEPVALRPANKLVELIRKSRALARHSAEDE